ncbi:MAG TPA: histidine phosphatase family protein [Vicinamibacterales bacterium]|nr:histidine phosphatase family protein [Vicinamibacterales bacterium]
MKAILVHHAEAVGPEVDPQRPLSERGREQADRLADALQARGVVPAAIWHSGKLRSRQTAEAFLRRSPFADFRMVRGLRPDDPPAWIHTELVADIRDILLVGHMPNIFNLARLLVPEGVALPLHGLVGFERHPDAWAEFLRLG